VTDITNLNTEVSTCRCYGWPYSNGVSRLEIRADLPAAKVKSDVSGELCWSYSQRFDLYESRSRTDR